MQRTHTGPQTEAGATGMKGKEQAMPTMSNASEALAAAVRRTLVSGSPSAPITREASCCLERPPAGIEASIETTPREWAGREVAGIARFRADDNPTSAVSRLHSCTFPDTSITTSSSTRTQPQPLQRRQQASFETPAESCSPAEVCDLSARQRTLHPHVTHEDLGESLASELLDKAQQIAHQYSPSKFLGKDVKVWDKENESQQEMPAAAQRQKRTTIFSPAVVPSPPSRNLGGRRASFRVTRFFERPTSDPDKQGTDSECQNIAIDHPFFSAAVKPTQTAPVLSSSQEDGSVFRERSGCDSCADSDSDQTTANNTSEICDTSASLPFTISVDVSDKAKIGISSAHPCGTDSRDHTFQIEGRLCSEPANSWRESGGHSLSPVFQAGGSAPPTAKAFGIDPTSVEVPVPPPRPPSDTLSIRSLNDAYSPPGKQVPESKDWFLFALISEISELLRGPGDPDTDCLAEKASTMSQSYAMPQASAAGESPVKVQLTPSSLLKPMAQVPRRKNEVPGKMAGFFDRCCDGCLSARENKQRIQMTGSLGIALEVDKEKKCMVVVGLDPHGPAARSGRVQLGDEIISIDSMPVDCLLDNFEAESLASQYLTGDAGSSVKIMVRRCEERCSHVYQSKITTDMLVSLTRAPRRRSGLHGVGGDGGETTQGAERTEHVPTIVSARAATRVPPISTEVRLPSPSQDKTPQVHLCGASGVLSADGKTDPKGRGLREVPLSSLNSQSRAGKQQEVRTYIQVSSRPVSRPSAVPALWIAGRTPRMAYTEEQ